MNAEPKSANQTLTDRIAGLPPERRALVERLLKDRETQPPAPRTPSAIPRRAPSSTAPLSYAQQRLWFLDQLAPGNPFYNESFFFRLFSSVDAAIFERALNEIVRRHETLRTSFKAASGQPLQVIAPELNAPLPVMDLRRFPSHQREIEARRRAEQSAMLPFDLTRLPLFRASLLQLDEGDFVFALTMHHIVCDGWSIPVLFRELSVLYDAFSKGEASPLPELPIQYADFAVWQREWLSGERLEGQIAYWKRQLADLPALQLPTDRPRPATPSYQGANRRFIIPQTVSTALDALARQEGATMFMTLLAAFQVLLARITGQEQVVVGAPSANRTHIETEPLIGFFVNSLVMRADLAGNPAFRAALGRVRETAAAAYAHQDVPFEKVVEALHPERDTARNPLFQVIFQYFPPSDLAADLEDNALKIEVTTSKFDLRLDIHQLEAGLLANLEYSADLFDAAAIDRMVNHFQNLLGGIATNPDQHIFDLPLLTQAESHQLTVAWNAAASDYPRHLTVSEYFEQRVEQSSTASTAIALEFQGGAWTYAELNRRANRLAHQLVSLGVGSGVTVGVTTERSPLTICALLAILKAGGAYVPLDPAWPVERLKFAAADARAGVILSLAAELDACAGGIQSLPIPADDPGADFESNPPSRAAAGDAAYVMTTSGSTGTPKSVSIAHRGILRLVCNPNYVTLDPAETLLQFAPLSFDASTFEIWGALLNGAKLAIFPPFAPSLDELCRFIEQSRVTTIWLTAPVFQQVVEDQLPRLGKLRQLLAGGDVLSPASVRQAAAALPGCRIINGYGPTENTTFTCTFMVPAGGWFGLSVPIGRPVSGTVIYVLDRYLRPAPIGAPGELWIGGEGLALGYLNRPELTAERFVPSPFQPGERLYRSGDLVRWRADGDLEFLGRIDRQVKIRGFRVEPGEIEHLLRQDPAVRECAVLAGEDSQGQKRLIAFVVLNPDQTDQLSETDEINPGKADFDEEGSRRLIPAVQSALGRRLPDYMVPSLFVALDEFPLNANGKIDHQALLAGLDTRSNPAEDYVAPRNPIEQELALIWMALLEVEVASVNDNFFVLGGHSLLGTQLISRIRDRFRVELPLRRLFETPTIEGLAEAIENEKSQQGQAATAIIPTQAALKIDELTDEEVDALLLKMIEQGGAFE